MIGDENEGCTFLAPGLKDEVDDWGARGALLQKFRELRELMKKRNIEPQFPLPQERVRELKDRSDDERKLAEPGAEANTRDWRRSVFP